VNIVEDVKSRGFDAVREWALELDGAEPARAVADVERLPREALLALADRVRRWHEAQRPQDVELEVEPGVVLQRRWVPLRSVVEARRNRYLMLNAPEESLDAICALVPGSRAPSVLPLAEPGMVAVHALVPAVDVWRLLPKLEEACASSILVVPVERMMS